MTLRETRRYRATMNILDAMDDEHCDAWDELQIASKLLEGAIYKMPAYAKAFAVEKFCAEFPQRQLLNYEFFRPFVCN
jgi:hypothetical protein